MDSEEARKVAEIHTCIEAKERARLYGIELPVKVGTEFVTIECGFEIINGKIFKVYRIVFVYADSLGLFKGYVKYSNTEVNYLNLDRALRALTDYIDNRSNRYFKLYVM